nr:serine/arginine repetitive matrix protein 1-like [Aegilops tauschii subsp. strangulata]
MAVAPSITTTGRLCLPSDLLRPRILLSSPELADPLDEREAPPRTRRWPRSGGRRPKTPRPLAGVALPCSSSVSIGTEGGGRRRVQNPKKILAATGRVRSPPDGSRRRPQPLCAYHVAPAPPAARRAHTPPPRPARATLSRASPPPSCAGAAVPRRRRLAAVLRQPRRSPPSARNAASVPRRRLPDPGARAPASSPSPPAGLLHLLPSQLRPPAATPARATTNPSSGRPIWIQSTPLG